MVRGIREAFGGSACSLLRINTQVPEKRTAPPVDMWTSSRPQAIRVMAPPAPEGRVLGALLSDEDIKAMQGLVNDLTLKALLPHIDKRVRSLNQQVPNLR